MSNPLWLDDLFAALMVALAAYSAGRLFVARVWSLRTHRDIDVAHVLMGTSMAGQLVSELNPVPNGVWEIVFGALAAWFAWRCYQFIRDPGTDSQYDDHVHRLTRRVIHLLMALAMLYMYLAAVPARIGTGMAMGTPTGTTADFALLPMVLVLAFLASAVWTLDGIGRFSRAARPASPSPVLVSAAGSPRVAEEPAAITAPTVSRRSDRPVRDAQGPRWLAPRLAEGAHVVMVVTMAYMLVLML